ncbi:MAG: capsular biosynthesis protein [Pseudomonadota bacterium]
MLRLIMSGATVEQELAAEFGPLPPSFLPVGVQRLYELQLKALGGAQTVHLVLPESFQPPAHDVRRLSELGVEIVSLPQGLRLGEAVVYAVNAVGAGEDGVHILHGDTLILDPPVEAEDIIVGGPRASEYAWAEVEVGEAGRVRGLRVTAAGDEGHGGWPIAAGYFSFSSSRDLVRSLTRARGDFVAGLNHYLEDHEVTLVPAAEWLDFGHLQTFFRSRLAVTTARAFNTVRIDGLTARKSSDDRRKIRAEAHWLNAIPPSVQVHSGRLLAHGVDGGRAYYETEYEFLPVVSELFVHGLLGRQAWMRVLSACQAMLEACAADRGDASADDALRSLCVDKTMERLERHARESGFPIDRPLRFAGRPTPSLLDVAARLGGAMDLKTGRSECVMHGDLCFSNLLYDSRRRRIRALDPRGAVGDRPGIYGDLRYDLAKLAHSIVGRYDQIIAGRYVASASDGAFDLEFEPIAAQPWLEEGLSAMTVDGEPALSRTVRAAMAGLFLSMLPLHADRPDRQVAFTANALRLFLDLEAA